MIYLISLRSSFGIYSTHKIFLNIDKLTVVGEERKEGQTLNDGDSFDFLVREGDEANVLLGLVRTDVSWLAGGH